MRAIALYAIFLQAQDGVHLSNAFSTSTYSSRIIARNKQRRPQRPFTSFSLDMAAATPKDGGGDLDYLKQELTAYLAKREELGADETAKK